MNTMKKFPPLTDFPTYVFIDASNIRAACLKTLNLSINFPKLLRYLQRKYPNLQDARYYEGIANDDKAKGKVFNQLRRAGYTVCPLERKTYIEPAVYKEIRCRQCKSVQKTRVLKKTTKMKSNVDVYLAADLLKLAYLCKKPVHVILVSCDGDYAEMIKSAIETNPKVRISVLATPPAKDFRKNTLSVRLKALFNEIPRYELRNINDIRDHIRLSQKMGTCPKSRSRGWGDAAPVFLL